MIRRTTVLWVLLLFAGFTMMAQDETTNPFRPSKNNLSVEVNFKPFSSDAPISIDGLRGRLFLGNKIAIRLGCNFATKKLYHETPVEYNNTTYYNTDEEKYTVLGLSTGVEYHFLNSKRFSPYVGAIVGYENKTSKAIYEDIDPEYTGGAYSYKMTRTEVKNAWNQFTGTESYFEQRGYSSIACNFVLGADIYIMKHLYMGLELGIGYNALFYKNIEVTTDGILDRKIPKAKETGIGVNVNNAIRLGFWF